MGTEPAELAPEVRQKLLEGIACTAKVTKGRCGEVDSCEASARIYRDLAEAYATVVGAYRKS